MPLRRSWEFCAQASRYRTPVGGSTARGRRPPSCCHVLHHAWTRRSHLENTEHSEGPSHRVLMYCTMLGLEGPIWKILNIARVQAMLFRTKIPPDHRCQGGTSLPNRVH